MWGPLASITLWHLRLHEEINLLISCRVILFHSSRRAFHNYSVVFGFLAISMPFLTLWPPLYIYMIAKSWMEGGSWHSGKSTRVRYRGESRHYVHFRTNAPRKGMKPLIIFRYGLNCTANVFLLGWLWH